LIHMAAVSATIKDMKIAIQGQAGSFHQQAAQIFYHSTPFDILPCATFADAFRALEDNEADALVVATDNSLYGSINEVYQLIEASSEPIIGEVALNIAQHLIAHPSATSESITEIYSHPVALAQCRNFLTTMFPDAELIEYFDTAGAVEMVRDMKSPVMAAIAGETAAKLYNLPIIRRDIHDYAHNVTRFAVLESRDNAPDANRASLVITTTHQPGALVEVLQAFAQANINISHLQSQPIIDAPGRYKFFITVDSAGNPLYRVCEKIEQGDHQITLLGEYRAAKER